MGHMTSMGQALCGKIKLRNSVISISILLTTLYFLFSSYSARGCSSAQEHREPTTTVLAFGHDRLHGEVGAPKNMSSATNTATCMESKTLEAEPSIEKDSFSIRVDRWLNNAEVFVTCPEFAASSPLVTSGSFFPNVLHRIWECRDLPPRYASSLSSWNLNSSNMVVLLWTEKLRKEYISKILGLEKLALYNRLKPGSYRADLFKYIVMHYIGGIYSDMDSNLLIHLNNVEFLREETTMAIDLSPTRLLPGAFLMAPPKQPVFVCAMGEVFDHSKERTYFGPDISGSLDVSGPGVLGECVRHMLGKDEAKFSPGKEHLATMKFRLLHSYLRGDGVHTVQLEEGIDFISLQPGGQSYDRQVSLECDPGEHYSTLYSIQQVYRPD